MKLLSELERSIKSMQGRVDEPELAGVVEALVRSAHQNRITVGFNNEPRSFASPLTDDSAGYLFRIRIKPHPVETTSRAELVFDILHELGHCFDRDTLALADQYNREKLRGRELRAWAWADQEFSQHPALGPYRNLYLSYQATCLGTYIE